MSSKAIFFDRDDTLIHDTHYMYKVEQLNYIDGVFETLKELQTRGFQLFIFSNQSGIGRGYFTKEQMDIFHDQLQKDFREHGVEFTEILYCPHAPVDNCDCRKPKPKILIEACEKYNLNPSECFMVGDRVTDAQAGVGAGMKGITIKCDDYENNVQDISELLKLV